MADAGPLSGTFVGAALVALTTSLPEVSTVASRWRCCSSPTSPVLLALTG